MFFRVIEQKLVAFAAQHLPGDRAVTGIVLGEVEGSRRLARAAEELDAVLAHEGAGAEPIEDAETFEGPVGGRHQGLAHLEGGSRLTLQQQRTEFLLCHKRRHRRSGGPAADDDDVEALIHSVPADGDR